MKATGNNVGSFLIPASGQLGGMIATGNKFYVRVWVNFEKTTAAIGNHSDFLVGATAQDNSGVELRLGFSSNQSGKPEMLDLNLIGSGAEVTRYSNGFTDGGNPGAFTGMGVQFTPTILIFDDATGQQIDLDLRGDDDEVLARLAPAGIEAAGPSGPRGRGRPKLGVTAREVTLLPRQWEWLGAQPGGASATLRRRSGMSL